MVGVRVEGIGVRGGNPPILSFFGAGGGGPWSVATEARDGLAFGGRGRASTHGAFSWVGGCLILRFFGAGKGGPWSGATEEGVGGGGS